MSEGSDKPSVSVETENGRTTIEVEDKENAAGVVRGFLQSLDAVVDDAERIYVEIDETVVTEPEATPKNLDRPEEPEDDEPEEQEQIDPSEVFGDDVAEGSDEPEEFDGLEIGAGTSNHAVATVLRNHGPSVLKDIASRIDDYPKGTVSSALTNLKNGHVVKKDSADGGPTRWTLTDWGHEQIKEIGEYGEEVEA